MSGVVFGEGRFGGDGDNGGGDEDNGGVDGSGRGVIKAGDGSVVPVSVVSVSLSGSNICIASSEKD